MKPLELSTFVESWKSSGQKEIVTCKSKDLAHFTIANIQV